MTILFDATARRQPTTRRRFGAGLLAFVPHSGRVDHTASDEAAYSQSLADREAAAREFDRAIEDRYARFQAAERVASGIPLF